MDREKMLQAFIDIDNASEISEAILRTVFYDEDLRNDRLQWLIAGAVEQVEKIKKAAEAIDGVMTAKENYLL